MDSYRRRLGIVATIFLLSTGFGVLVTQEGGRVPLHPEQLAAAGGVYEFAWSPDSQSIAYIAPGNGGFELWTISGAGGQSRRLTSTQRLKKQPRWSPDGKSIAFITIQDDGNGDLRTVSADGGSTLATLTDTPFDEANPAWSPDGTRIAFTQGTGTGTRLVLMDLRTNTLRRLADTPASDLQWSPDGRHIAFVANLLTPSDERRENKDIFMIPSEGGAPRLLTPGTPRFHDSSPSWAPDSRQLVYTSEESGFSNLYILDTQNGNRRALTMGNVDNIAPKWSPDGTRIAYVRNENALLHVYTIAVQDGRIVRVSERDGVNGGFESADAGPPGMLSWSPDGRRLAFTHSDPARTSDVWLDGPENARPQQLTYSMPADLRRESRFVWPEPMTYRSFDGQEISALIYEPKGAQPRSGHPALLIFRDALDGQHAVSWDPFVQFMVSNGYLVFAPNVRGSSGAGSAYRRLVAGHGGNHDVRDALFGLDRLSSEGLIDTERVGVYGSGTGGFLAMAALIRSEARFKAAIGLNAVVDAVTAASYPSLQEWTRYMIGSNPLQNPIAYFERSVVNFVGNLRTPVVLLYAGRNPNVPSQQLQQFAVQAEVNGKWYDYRVFENESGGWRSWREANMRLTLEAMDAVFEKYLMGRDRDVRLTRNR